MEFVIDEPLRSASRVGALLLLLVDVDSVALVETIENPGNDRQWRGGRGGAQKLFTHRQNSHFRVATKEEKVD